MVTILLRKFFFHQFLVSKNFDFVPLKSKFAWKGLTLGPPRHNLDSACLRLLLHLTSVVDNKFLPGNEMTCGSLCYSHTVLFEFISTLIETKQ